MDEILQRCCLSFVCEAMTIDDSVVDRGRAKLP
jgi:hypothetical protein